MTMRRERRERSAWPAVLFVAALLACDSWHGPGGGGDCALDAIGGDDDSVIGDGGTTTPTDAGGGGDGDSDSGDGDAGAGGGDAGALEDAGTDAAPNPTGESPSEAALELPEA